MGTKLGEVLGEFFQEQLEKHYKVKREFTEKPKEWFSCNSCGNLSPTEEIHRVQWSNPKNKKSQAIICRFCFMEKKIPYKPEKPGGGIHARRQASTKDVDINIYTSDNEGAIIAMKSHRKLEGLIGKNLPIGEGLNG